MVFLFFTNLGYTKFIYSLGGGGSNLLEQLVTSIKALSSGKQNEQGKGLVPVNQINRDSYLKKHWSAWGPDDISLDRKRATEKLKCIPARSGARCTKSLIELMSNTRYSLIEFSIKLNQAADRKAAIREFICNIDPVISALHGEVKKGLMFLLKGEGSRFAPGGQSSIDLTSGDLKNLNEGLKIARERESRARGGRGGFRSYRGRGGYRGRGYGSSSFYAGQSAATASIYNLLNDQRREGRQNKRGGGSGGQNACFICGSSQHYARSCPDRH